MVRLNRRTLSTFAAILFETMDEQGTPESALGLVYEVAGLGPHEQGLDAIRVLEMAGVLRRHAVDHHIMKRGPEFNAVRAEFEAARGMA